jgi:hypothetical protein
MEALKVTGSDSHPTIILDHLENKYSIAGESRPENPMKFYEPVFNWFNNYFNHVYVFNDLNTPSTKSIKKLTIKLDYFNSTSAKVLFDLFTMLNEVGSKKFNVSFEIDWYYPVEDTDMLDAGKEMEKMCGLKFNYCPKI